MIRRGEPRQSCWVSREADENVTRTTPDVSHWYLRKGAASPRVHDNLPCERPHLGLQRESPRREQPVHHHWRMHERAEWIAKQPAECVLSADDRTRRPPIARI